MELPNLSPSSPMAQGDFNVVNGDGAEINQPIDDNVEEIVEDDTEVLDSVVADEGEECTNEEDPMHWLCPIVEPAPKKTLNGNHHFESDPIVRKRLCNKLFKRLKQILDEFGASIGQQVAIIVAQPSVTHGRCIKTYGSNPLQKVISRYHPTIRKSLLKALTQQASSKKEIPAQPKFELPPLVIEGNHVPINKMTQAQLREFIPFMLRYSTGRGKPGWGQDKTRPPWWPYDLPWSNIRIDSRDAESKSKECWSAALRRIIFACYNYHGRDDLLKENNASETKTTSNKWKKIISNDTVDDLLTDSSSEDEERPEAVESDNTVSAPDNIVVNPDGTVSLYIPENRSTDENEKRHVVLTDTEGHEYFVEIALPANQPALIANFQISQASNLQEPTSTTSEQTTVGLSS